MFLHGYLSCKESFAYQKSFFERDFNVYIPDLKGFGTNKGMEYPYSLDDYIKEVKKYVLDNGLSRPHVIAHSFGARITLKLAYQEKDFFDKIVLTGAAGLKPKRSFKLYLKKSLYKTLKVFIPKDKLSLFYSKDYNSLDSIMKQSFIKIVNENLDYTLNGINNKTLLVFGKEDRETPIYMAERLKKGIKDSELLVFDGAGHFPFIDKPFKFNTEVREFLLSN